MLANEKNHVIKHDFNSFACEYWCVLRSNAKKKNEIKVTLELRCAQKTIEKKGWGK